MPQFSGGCGKNNQYGRSERRDSHMDPRHFNAPDISTRGALLFGDDCAGTDEALAAIENAGLSCRILDRVESAHLALRGAHVDLVVIETAATSQSDIDALLARIIPYIRETDTPIVATASMDQIDLLWSQLAPIGAQILCQPTAHDRRVAIEAVLGRPACTTLQDSSPARARELEILHNDVARLVKTVRGMVESSHDDTAASPMPGASPAASADEVRHVIRTRRLRDRFFDSGLFADPAWDMLLDLYAAHLERREVSISSLCIAAATPPTTALRWIGLMTDANIFERRPDERDKRRHLVMLSDTALHAIDRYFAALRSMSFG